jgi:hypothetical protein
MSILVGPEGAIYLPSLPKRSNGFNAATKLDAGFMFGHQLTRASIYRRGNTGLKSVEPAISMAQFRTRAHLLCVQL